MRRFSSMTSALALAASFLSPIAASAEPLPSLGSDDSLARLSPHAGNIDPFYGDINPFYGDIDPFYGDINPFYGDINPFYGDISPFWGDISPFWGDINPFYGDIEAFWGDISPFYGDISPFFGDIQPFWGDIGPFWGDISAAWGDLDTFSTETSSDYQTVADMLQDLIARSETFWGASVFDQTGKSFSEGFADAILSKYGIDLTDPASLENLTAGQRSLFFLDWYDGLMNFSGADHVDYWMSLVNWSPSLTQDQANNVDATVGLLDVKIPNNGTLGEKVKFVGGYDYSVNSHGIAVAGLIAGKHDGEGVMGIAPDTKLLNYNPFDDTGTASWDDVTKGIIKLGEKHASVINMSLGVAGWTLHDDWKDVFGNDKVADLDEVIFVKAAGNEGTIQTADITWDGDDPYENLIIVGSVGPTGQISYFSNTPGEACILTGGACREENKLKYRFLVAPGELILTHDNDGNLARVSGTSFAAPLVTGAITLLHDRWPWLQEYVDESVDIMFQSARDLGDPGVDGTYGWGLLDVEASQSPLSFDNLRFYMPQDSSKLKFNSKDFNSLSSASLKDALLAPGALALFQDQGAYLFALESIGDTFRDFNIPLSTLVYGQTLSTKYNDERFQRHLYQRLIDWSTGSGFTDFQDYSSPLVSMNDFSFEMTATELTTDEMSAGQDEVPFYSEFSVRHERSGLAFQVGSGTGATSLYRQDGFGFKSDYDIETGGVNPLLGLASGDAFAAVSLDLKQGTSLSIGFTSNDDDHLVQDTNTGREISVLDGFDNYQAAAYTVGFNHVLTDKLTILGSYALLAEETGLLGSQGKGALSLNGGAMTDNVTLGVTATPNNDITLSASATIAQTRSTEFDNSLLGVAESGIQSTAFALSGYKHGVFGKEDGFRLSLTQPLHIESGAIEYTSLQVIDRRTGELGVVTEIWDQSPSDRKLVTEMLYSTPVLASNIELNIFGETRFNDHERDDDRVGWSLGVGLGGRF